MPLCSIIRHLLLWTIVLSLLNCTHTGDKDYLPVNVPYFFSELHVKGYEGMMELINPWLAKASDIRAEEFSIGSSLEMDPTIRQAYIIALSRAHHDAVVDKLVKSIRFRTSTKADFFSMMSVIARQSSAGLKNPDRSPLERATYFYILENIITATSVHIVNDKRVTEILQIIANANINIPDAVHNERYLHALEPRSLSPSEVAKNILKKSISP